MGVIFLILFAWACNAWYVYFILTNLAWAQENPVLAGVVWGGAVVFGNIMGGFINAAMER